MTYLEINYFLDLESYIFEYSNKPCQPKKQSAIATMHRVRNSGLLKKHIYVSLSRNFRSKKIITFLIILHFHENLRTQNEFTLVSGYHFYSR